MGLRDNSLLYRRAQSGFRDSWSSKEADGQFSWQFRGIDSCLSGRRHAWACRQILELHEFFTRLSRSGKCPSRKRATVAVCLETVPVWGLLENSGKNPLWGYKNAMTY